MKINQVLPVVPVRDLEVAADWYEKLFGRPADDRPMESLAEWTLTGDSTLQVLRDATNAGHAEVNLVVDSVDEAAAALRDRGVAPGDVEEVPALRVLPMTDPDGNTVQLLEPR